MATIATHVRVFATPKGMRLDPTRIVIAQQFCDFGIVSR